MKRTRTRRFLLTAAVAVVVLVSAAIFAAPALIHQFLITTLDDYGVKARIDNVDANLFTGYIAVDNAEGKNTDGQGFNIGHLAVHLDYWPLAYGEIRFSGAKVRDSQLDIRLRANKSLGVGGVTTVAPPGQKTRRGWRFGFDKLYANGLNVHYSQAKTKTAGAFSQSATFKDSTTHNLLFFKHDKPIRLNVELRHDNARLGLNGQLQVFGGPIHSDVHVQTKNFDLSDLAYYLDSAGFKRVTGRLDADLDLQLSHDSKQPLAIRLNGRLHYAQPRIARTNQMTIQAEQFDWDGQVDISLLRANDQPPQIDSQGKLEFDDLAVRYPKGFSIKTLRGQWRGNSRLTVSPEQNVLSAKGKMQGRETSFQVPKKIKFDLARFHWQGRAGMTISDVIARHADGHFTATGANLDLPLAPIAFRARHVLFDGRYSQKPSAKSDALPVDLEGDLTTQSLLVIDQSHDAYWAAAEKTRFKSLKLAGIDDMTVKRLAADQLRLLQRPGQSLKQPANHAAIRIDELQAQHFSLQNERRYRFKALDLTSADFRLLRDPNGHIPAARFFDKSNNKKAQKTHASPHTAEGDGTGSNSQLPSLAIDTLRIGHGSNFHFRDASIDPEAKLGGHDLRLTVDGIDTAQPRRPAHFKLQTAFNRSGTLRANGQIAPLASGGPNTDTDITIRSLQLPPLSAYLRRILGRSIASGVLNSDIHAQATNGNLDGKVHLHLSNFHLAKSNSHSTVKTLGLPLKTALTVLRSDNDVIELSAGLQGDLATPYFSVTDLFREAVIAGLHDAVMSAASPVGLLAKIGNAIANIGDAVDLHPIEFKTGSTQLTDDARNYLAHVKTILAEHTHLALRLHTPEQGRRALAQRRIKAVRQYLAARGVDGARVQRSKTTPGKAATLGLTVTKAKSR